MTRFHRTLGLVVAWVCVLSLPAVAAGPNVSRKVVTDESGATTVVIQVSATDRAIYGLTIEEAGASIEDVYAPDGWVGISTGDRVIFRTVDTPIASGKSTSFRIVMPDTKAGLGISFRDSKAYFGEKKSI